ncbi:MAG: DUF5995 family protein [Acidimicrobiia bacterium]|nr:DUF5995 family protein [Acidimicrobiia bacterium]
MLTATIDQLRTVAAAADDASGYFPAMYSRVTSRVEQASARMEPSQAASMERFARTFAAWYLEPISGRRPMPGCWQAAADVAGDADLLIAQQLLLGINAHVNHDLPQVVVELADATGNLTALRPGFDSINDLLAETYPALVRDVGRVAWWMAALSARDNGRAFNFSLHRARDIAWMNAERLYALPPDQRPAAAAQLDDAVSVLAYLVTRPPWPVSWAVPVLGRLESSTPGDVTAALLGPLG